jgi:hypothetical protein
LWFWSYPEKSVIFIVLGIQEVILPFNLTVEKGGECPNLDVPNKRIKVQLPILRDGLIMEICLTEEVLIHSRGFYKGFDKICWM